MSAGKGSKGKNYAIDRRRMRRREKQRSDSSQDVMIGKAARRGWGNGVVR